jgi:hypothetical protein
MQAWDGLASRCDGAANRRTSVSNVYQRLIMISRAATMKQ